MSAWLKDLSLFLQMAAVAALAMYIPAFFAVSQSDFHAARAFFYSATLFLFLIAMIGLAMANSRPRLDARNQLLSLLGAFALLPVMLAVPFNEALGTTSFFNAYFEMVSSLTTTGATLFDEPDRLSATLHFWRAIVGWLGGFLAWVMAAAILAPMNLGGFEVSSTDTAGQGAHHFTQISKVATASERMLRFGAMLLPVYTGLTLVLWIGLILAGDVPFVALSHAMSTLSTSGISPVGGLAGGDSGRVGELLIFFFLIFAVSQKTFLPGRGRNWPASLLTDPEIRIALMILIIVPSLLFLRHWIGAYEINDQEDIPAAFSSLWGGFFTVFSYLTTSGFESADWVSADSWSGLRTPGMILMGLAVFGGGVATTAGGVKLFRVYALFKHGVREIEKLSHPSSVGGQGATARLIRRKGAYIAWIFFMLFALSIALITLALALTGIDLEPAMIFSVSALSTTGPLAVVAGETPYSYADLDVLAKSILAGAMILGRLEALAIIALFNPEFWRT